MIETLIGTVLGGVFRLIPEGMKWFERKDERKHELSMFDKQLEADKVRGQLAVQQADATIGIAEVQAIIEATKAQGQRTGVKWVDAINALIRPLLALQWLIIMWPAVIVSGFYMAVGAGTDPLVALHAAFGQDEKAMAASVASFWLVDRSLKKMFKYGS